MLCAEQEAALALAAAVDMAGTLGWDHSSYFLLAWPPQLTQTPSCSDSGQAELPLVPVTLDTLVSHTRAHQQHRHPELRAGHHRYIR